MRLTIPARDGGRLHRLLTGPTLAETLDYGRAARSPWYWRPHDTGPGYRLTPLGVLHRFGITLRVHHKARL